jgi:hypothetical protein
MNGKKRWGRRVGTAVTWAALNYSIACLQPALNLDGELINLIIEKSTQIAGLLIVGLSGTDAVRDYAGKK